MKFLLLSTFIFLYSSLALARDKHYFIGITEAVWDYASGTEERNLFQLTRNSPISIFKMVQIVLEENIRRPFILSTQMAPLVRL